ncbi:hypothetical protein [Nocardia aurantia]|uniref:Tetratricopeptide repeat protein n=1 Tax=Nocardia aurantia TaxID=2585199 RepID=A0A7K0DNX9_9NOCA|nr:hypothetical protein [Nocardia aurantia]MQY27391.1 hypothetical protein [Nocardia aurantia]
MSLQQFPEPDGRAENVVALARIIAEDTASRQDLMQALDRLEIDWTRVLFAIDDEVAKCLGHASPAVPEAATVDGVLLVAGALCRVYDLPAISVTMMAVAVAVTADLALAARMTVVTAILDSFGESDLEDLPTVVSRLESGVAESSGVIADPPRRADLTVLGGLLSGLTRRAGALSRVTLAYLSTMMVLQTGHLLLVPLTVSAIWYTRHPYDLQPVTERVCGAGRETVTAKVPWYAVLVLALSLAHAPVPALLILLGAIWHELLDGTGEFATLLCLRSWTGAERRCSAAVPRIAAIVAVTEPVRYLARVAVAAAAAFSGLWLTRALTPVTPAAIPALLFATILLGRRRIVWGAVLFTASGYLGAGAVPIAIQVACGCAAWGAIARLHRVPPTGVPLSSPSRFRLTRGNRGLRRAHRLAEAGRYRDAAALLTALPRPGSHADPAATLLAWVLWRDGRPAEAVAAVRAAPVAGGPDAVHHEVLRAAVEVQAQLDLEAPPARGAAAALARYRSAPRCNREVLRESALAEARSIAAEPNPDPAQIMLMVEITAHLVPRVVGARRVPIAARLIAACAECLVAVDPAAAEALLSVRFTAIGTTVFGEARDFARIHALADADRVSDDDATIVVAAQQVEPWPERILLWRCRSRVRPSALDQDPATTPQLRALAALLTRYRAAFTDCEQGRRAELAGYESYLAAAILLENSDFRAGQARLAEPVVAALRRSPGTPDRIAAAAAATLGRTLLRLGDYDSAAAAFEHAALFEPDSDRRLPILVAMAAAALWATADDRAAEAERLLGMYPGPAAERLCVAFAAIRSGHAAEPAALRPALDSIRDSSSLAYCFAAGIAIRALAAAGRRPEAEQMSAEVSQWATPARVAAWIRAALDNVLAEPNSPAAADLPAAASAQPPPVRWSPTAVVRVDGDRPPRDDEPVSAAGYLAVIEARGV